MQNNESLDNVIPGMNITVGDTKEISDNVVSEETLLGIYNEILINLRAEQAEVNDTLDKFLDMVINGGDSSGPSKEAVVNLLKLKSTEIPDKMIKIADLMTRIFLKERDTFPRYLAAKQNNTINITNEKQTLIEEIEKKIKNKKG